MFCLSWRICSSVLGLAVLGLCFVCVVLMVYSLVLPFSLLRLTVLEFVLEVCYAHGVLSGVSLGIASVVAPVRSP